MDFRRAWLALLVAACAAVAIGGAAEAAKPNARNATNRRVTRPASVQAPSRVASIDNVRRIDINTINMFMTNYGSFAWDLTSGNAGLIWPKGTTKTAVFASGLWFGAYVGTDQRTLVAEYSQEYAPGPLQPTLDPNNPDFRTWKVVRFSGDADSAHVEREPNEAAVEDELVHHSWSEYMAGAAPYGAPWKLHRLPLTVTSEPTDSIDVPGPDVLGDQMLWSVYNDADVANHTNDAGNSDPLGLEVQQTTFAFNRQGALGQIIFLKYRIINKGGQQLDSMFVSLWSDTDLGGAADDLVGVDTTLSLGYTYNSTNNDQLYGTAPPAVGFDFFQGPRYIASDPTSPRLPMTSFNKYINGTDPASTSDTYNYMNGINPDGTDVIDPTTGQPTLFFHPGDPTTGQGWLDANPADRRHLLSSGPFYMAAGDTQEVVAALIIGNGTNRLSSIDAMFFYDDFAQLAFDEGFQLPNPPPQPTVEVLEQHESVTLSWDDAAPRTYAEPGYAFEGYNVYQGESVAGPWRLLATYDLVNGILDVRDTVFVVELGQTINDYPVASGTDAGLHFTFTATEDVVRGGPLKDATEYYYAVTAYAVSSTEKLAVVENAQDPITVMPQRPASGTDPGTASATDVTYLQRDSSLPPSTTVVEVVVTKPDSVTGHIYKVFFEALPPESVYVRQVGSDTATVTHVWSLVDSTASDTLIRRQLNLRGDDNYVVIDGIQVRVVGAYFPELQSVVYRNVDATHRRALDGVSSGGEIDWLMGGGMTGDRFFGSSLDPATEPDSFMTVEIRFSSTNTQLAHRFLRHETAAGAGLGFYQYGRFQTVPFQAWDAINNVQLDAAFVERAVVDGSGNLLPTQPASHDSTWGPTAEASPAGGREYLFVFNTPYTGAENANFAHDDALFDTTATGESAMPVLYAAWTKLRSGTDVIDDDDRIDFVWANPPTVNDVYAFGTSQLVRSNTALAKGGLQSIRAVPNPYYNRSRYEINQFNRKIRFVNLPETATIRIFNLAGELVRTLDKTDVTSSVLEWDILTENRLPVASGVYIFHVDSPGVGSMFGRMVVFMEKERLNNF